MNTETQFETWNLRRFKAPQVRTMAIMLGYRGRGMTRAQTIEWIADYAKRDEICNKKTWSKFYMVRDGKDPNAQTGGSIDKDELAVMINDQLGGVQEKVHAATEGLEGKVQDAVAKVVEQLAGKALKEAAENYRPIKIIGPGKKVKKLKDTLPACFDRIVQLASRRRNILLVGPAGCGKTFIASKVAESLSLDFASQSCTEGMSESYLTGWMLPIGKGGQFVYVPAQFIERFEKGGVFLLDEIDSSDPNVLLVINQALANGEIFIPQRHTNPRVVRHKDFVCIAAANTYGNGADEMYVGRNQLDAATLDRFRAGIIKMEYDERVEKAIVNPEVLAWGLEIRKRIKDHRMRKIMSTRVMLDLSEMTENCEWKREDWEESFFADWSEDEVRRVRFAA